MLVVVSPCGFHSPAVPGAVQVRAKWVGDVFKYPKAETDPPALSILPAARNQQLTL